MNETETKAFDCVAMKRQIQEALQRETEGMTASELIEFYNSRAETGSLSQFWKEAQEATRLRNQHSQP